MTHISIPANIVGYYELRNKENDDLLKETEIFAKIHKALKYFGFILRYPLDKEHITGYKYEPWHIRYVGDDIAMNIGTLTLEEYIERNK